MLKIKDTRSQLIDNIVSQLNAFSLGTPHDSDTQIEEVKTRETSAVALLRDEIAPAQVTDDEKANKLTTEN